MQVIANYENVSNDNVCMNVNMNYSKVDISVHQQMKIISIQNYEAISKILQTFGESRELTSW